MCSKTLGRNWGASQTNECVFVRAFVPRQFLPNDFWCARRAQIRHTIDGVAMPLLSACVPRRVASHQRRRGGASANEAIDHIQQQKNQHPTKRLCATWLMHRAVSPRWKCITRFLVMVCDASPCNGLSTPHIYRKRAVRVPKKNGARRENNHAHLHIYIRCSHTARSWAAALSW